MQRFIPVHAAVATLFAVAGLAAAPLVPGQAGSGATSAGTTASRVTMTARLTRGSSTLGSGTLPSWHVELSISNQSAVPVRLGQVMSLVTEAPGVDPYLGVFIRRLLDTDTPEWSGDRYAMTWGVEVPPKGKTVWPLGRLGARLDVLTIMLSMDQLEIAAIDGGGYGPPILPGTSRTIRDRFLFPFDPEAYGTRHGIVIMPPLLSADTAEPLQYLFTFDVNGRVASGLSFEPVASDVLPAQPADLEAIVRSNAPLWRRMVSLNMLVDHRPAAAGRLLLELAAADVPGPLKASSLAGLGLARTEGARAVLTAAVEQTDHRPTRLMGLRALADLGDPSVAPVVRPFITHADLATAHFAMQTAARLKDAESVPLLSSVLADAKARDRHDSAALALARLGGENALSTLVATLRSSRASADTRTSVATAMKIVKLRAATDALSAVVADERDDRPVRQEAIEALRAIGGPAVIPPFRAAAASRDRQVRSSAVRALLGLGESGVAVVLEIAQAAESPGRSEAVDALRTGKVHAALPLFRQLAADASAPVDLRVAGIDALGVLLDESAVALLASLVSDRAERIAVAAVSALGSIGLPATPALEQALDQPRTVVRREAVRGLQRSKALASVPALWRAYLRETDVSLGSTIADALVALKFQSAEAVPTLVAGLDQRRNRLWFSHVVLLRHLTDQRFGPADARRGSAAEREAELQKWRDWCTASGRCKA